MVEPSGCKAGRRRGGGSHAETLNASGFAHPLPRLLLDTSTTAALCFGIGYSHYRKTCFFARFHQHIGRTIIVVGDEMKRRRFTIWRGNPDQCSDPFAGSRKAICSPAEEYGLDLKPAHKASRSADQWLEIKTRVPRLRSLPLALPITLYAGIFSSGEDEFLRDVTRSASLDAPSEYRAYKLSPRPQSSKSQRAPRGPRAPPFSMQPTSGSRNDRRVQSLGPAPDWAPVQLAGRDPRLPTLYSIPNHPSLSGVEGVRHIYIFLEGRQTSERVSLPISSTLRQSATLVSSRPPEGWLTLGEGDYRFFQRFVGGRTSGQRRTARSCEGLRSFMPDNHGVAGANPTCTPSPMPCRTTPQDLTACPEDSDSQSGADEMPGLVTPEDSDADSGYASIGEDP
ncbi:hypothetical protein LXA43DRAFT_1063395 [Ganoderma leucocontextum]|nr:hypothetical protein LXA43DRAFT_1063395 [Ganoderma leucocontextum]